VYQPSAGFALLKQYQLCKPHTMVQTAFASKVEDLYRIIREDQAQMQQVMLGNSDHFS